MHKLAAPCTSRGSFLLASLGEECSTGREEESFRVDKNSMMAVSRNLHGIDSE